LAYRVIKNNWKDNIPAESLIESEERLRLALEAADIGIWEWNLQTGVFTWSENIERLFSLKEESLKSTYKSFLNTIHPDDRSRIDAELHKAIQERRSYDEEYRIIRSGNEIRWLRIRGNVYLDENGRVRCLMGSIHDKTERKLALEALKNARNTLEKQVNERTKELSLANISLKKEIEEREKLQKEIMEISEREQQRIGQDLHDSLSQQIGGIIFMSQVLKEKLARKQLGEAHDLQKIIDHLKSALKHTRDLSRGLFPVLEKGGLNLALKELALAMEGIFDVHIDLIYDEKVQITDRQSTIHIFRIVQEAINNAIKHGQASKISITLAKVKKKLVLEISDNGAGFPQMPNKKGMGLNIMKYRISMIAATFEIISKKGKGTTIKCWLKNPGKLARKDVD
jgi:PAS domain S-box-containing protein